MEPPTILVGRWNPDCHGCAGLTCRPAAAAIKCGGHPLFSLISSLLPSHPLHPHFFTRRGWIERPITRISRKPRLRSFSGFRIMPADGGMPLDGVAPPGESWLHAERSSGRAGGAKGTEEPALTWRTRPSRRRMATWTSLGSVKDGAEDTNERVMTSHSEVCEGCEVASVETQFQARESTFHAVWRGVAALPPGPR